MTGVVVTLNLSNLGHIGIYGLPWVVALKVKYLSYLTVMVCFFFIFCNKKLNLEKNDTTYAIPSNVRKGRYVRLNSSHLTWESMGTIIGGACPITDCSSF